MMLGAVDIDGFVLPMCELIEAKRGHDDNDPTRGTIDTERFLLWVEQNLCPNLGCAVEGGARSIVVADNASIHQDPRFRDLVEDAGGILIYLAPYSPDLNPIEFCFHQYKASLRRNFCHGRGVSIGDAHIQALNSVTHENMCNYYNKIGCITMSPRTQILRANSCLHVLHHF
jgi:hypothetical protein